MCAPRPTHGASFGPDALRAICQAFDAAWAEIAANFGDDPIEIDDARDQLATAMLSIASEDSRDRDVLKKAALLTLALAYRDSSATYHALVRRADNRAGPLR